MADVHMQKDYLLSLRLFHRMSSLGWNYQAKGDLYKAMCDSCLEPPVWPGLSSFCAAF